MLSGAMARSHDESRIVDGDMKDRVGAEDKARVDISSEVLNVWNAKSRLLVCLRLSSSIVAGH